MPARVTVDQTAKYIPFLVELRRRLLFLLCLFLITSILGFIYYEKIIKFVLRAFNFEGVNIVFTSPFQFISLAINSSLILGLIVIFPVILFQVLAFLKPAFHPREYKTAISILPLGLLLFVAGFAYGILIMRYTVQMFYQKSLELGVGNFLDVSFFLSQTLITAILLGIAFQFPLVLTFLLRSKLIDYHFLSGQRHFIYGFSLIFAALLPPTDLLSLLLLFLPLALLFELTLILNKLVFRPHPLIT